MARARKIQKKAQDTNRKLSLSIPKNVKLSQVLCIADTGEIYSLQVSG